MNTDLKPRTTVSLSQLSTAIENLNLDQKVVFFEIDFNDTVDNRFPLQIDAMMIILVRNGEGVLGIDLIEHKVSKNSLIVLQPKNYLFLSEFQPNTKVEVIACASDIVEDILPRLTDIMPMLLHNRANPVTTLSDDGAARLHQYYDFIARQLEPPCGFFTKQKVLRLLQAALYEMMEVTHTNEIGEATHQRSRSEEIMARFIIAVTENFRKERLVSFYANELCITPKHLSAVVKSISGRTAGEWIDNYVIMEAKVLLKTTDNTIQEISDKLNFKNQSFFGKFFKHNTGQTPSNYRKLYT